MNNFLLKKSDSTFMYIFFDTKNNTLSMKSYSKKGYGSNITVLRQNVEKDFACTIDNKGVIHVVFSIVNGGIHYGYFIDNTFKSFQILSAKTAMNYNKHLAICAAKEPVCIFYTIQHNGKNILSMQSVDCSENTSTSPIAIDYISASNSVLGFCENMEGNIFIAYPKDTDTKTLNIMREIKRTGSTVKAQEYFSKIDVPLLIDSFYFQDEKCAKILCHTTPGDYAYIITLDPKILIEEIDIKSFPRNQSTFYGLIPIYDKLHCYLCTNGNLYSSVLRGGSGSLNLEKQPRQYGGSIFPICCTVNEILPANSVIPGNMLSGIFFYIFNPFADIKNIEDTMDISRIISMEKRISDIEKYLKELHKNTKIPRDVVDPDFDT